MIGSVRLYRANIDRVRPCYQGLCSTAETWLSDTMDTVAAEHGIARETLGITVDAKTWDVIITWEEGAAALLRTPGNGASFSPCGLYRYTLERTWDAEKPRLGWVMLNPSTADASTDDLTVKKCMAFAHRWGYGGIVVVNMSPFRSTDPKDVPWGNTLAEGEQGANYNAWRWALTNCKAFIAAWGRHNVTPFDKVAVDMFRNLGCLGRCNDGSPWHPSRIGYDTIPIVYAFDGEVVPWQA